MYAASKSNPRLRLCIQELWGTLIHKGTPRYQVWNNLLNFNIKSDFVIVTEVERVLDSAKVYSFLLNALCSSRRKSHF
jgi:hypothetical protein